MKAIVKFILAALCLISDLTNGLAQSAKTDTLNFQKLIYTKDTAHFIYNQAVVVSYNGSFKFSGLIQISSEYFLNPFTINSQQGTVDGIVKITKSTFLDSMNVNGIEFTRPVKLDQSTYFKPLLLKSLTFDSLFSLDTACVIDVADFRNTKFKQGAVFSGTKFGSVSTFRGAFVDSVIDFQGSIVGTIADFSSIKFGSQAEIQFSGAQLPEVLDFSDNKRIPNEIDFTKARFLKNSKTFIKIYNSEIPKLHLDYMNFKLLLEDHEGNELSEDDATSVYEALLKNFKDRGQETSYRLLDLEYKRYQHSVLWVIPYAWDCHGYEKERIFYWTGGLLILFTVFTFFRLDRMEEAYRIPNIAEASSSTKSALDNENWRPIAKRIVHSLIYTSYIFFPLNIKIDEIKIKEYGLDSFIILFIYTFGLICVGYIASFVLQK
jgi:hypothetical protein